MGIDGKGTKKKLHVRPFPMSSSNRRGTKVSMLVKGLSSSRSRLTQMKDLHMSYVVDRMDPFYPSLNIATQKTHITHNP